MYMHACALPYNMYTILYIHMYVHDVLRHGSGRVGSGLFSSLLVLSCRERTELPQVWAVCRVSVAPEVEYRLSASDVVVVVAVAAVRRLCMLLLSLLLPSLFGVGVRPGVWPADLARLENQRARRPWLVASEGILLLL